MPEDQARAPLQPLVAPGGIETFQQDMTVTASADVTLASLQERLAALNQWVPIDGDPQMTLGDLVTFNSSGPLRLGYGAWRDLLLGAQFRNGRGELITAGGRTVKNVAGYDLTKFMVGQRGVFGRLVTITSRTYRRPAGAVVARFLGDVRILNRLMPTPLRPQWALLRPGAMWCGYLGDERSLAYYQQNLAAVQPVELLRRTLEDDVAERAAAWSARPAWRAAVPPIRIGEFAVRAAVRRWVADAAFGAVRIYDELAEAEQLKEAAEGVGGTVWAESGPVQGVYGPAEMELLKQLKSAFDPDGSLEQLML